jgi:hypothetical protein
VHTLCTKLSKVRGQCLMPREMQCRYRQKPSEAPQMQDCVRSTMCHCIYRPLSQTGCRLKITQATKSLGRRQLPICETICTCHVVEKPCSDCRRPGGQGSDASSWVLGWVWWAWPWRDWEPMSSSQIRPTCSRCQGATSRAIGWRRGHDGTAECPFLVLLRDPQPRLQEMRTFAGCRPASYGPVLHMLISLPACMHKPTMVEMCICGAKSDICDLSPVIAGRALGRQTPPEQPKYMPWSGVPENSYRPRHR